jgi:hypothetical protein
VGAQRTRFLGHFFVAHKEVAEEAERKNSGNNRRLDKNLLALCFALRTIAHYVLPFLAKRAASSAPSL